MNGEVRTRTNEEIKDIIREKISVPNLSVKDIETVNFRPHAPLIGLKTIKACSSVSITGEEPCSRKGCTLKLNEHHGDKVLFMYLSAPVDKQKANDALVSIKSILEENKLDGVAFVQKDKECVFV